MRWCWALMLCACGTLESQSGAPANAPASGLGPIAPITDDTGLSWVPPFILSAPARDLGHPSVIVDGDSIDLWVSSSANDVSSIGHAHASSFEAGMGDLDEALRATRSWEHGSVSSPSVISTDLGPLMMYVASGRVGLARYDGDAWTAGAVPIYADATGAISAVAAARVDDRARLLVLIDGRIDALECSLASLASGAPSFSVTRAVLTTPSWGTRLLDVGLRIDRTATGRWREDAFFGAALPNVMDFGAQPTPSAVGAASHFLDEGAMFSLVTLPVSSGPPFPTSATTVVYRGGVLFFYSARSGPRNAIGIGRWP